LNVFIVIETIFFDPFRVYGIGVLRFVFKLSISTLPIQQNSKI